MIVELAGSSLEFILLLFFILWVFTTNLYEGLEAILLVELLSILYSSAKDSFFMYFMPDLWSRFICTYLHG